MIHITPQDRIVALDLETTGLSPSWDTIVEFAAVCWQDGREIAQFQALVNPLRPIPPSAILIHGITDAMVQDQPTVAEMLPSFLDFCSAEVLLAHNARFDMSFLRAACHRAGRPPFKRHVYDTCAIARQCLPGQDSYGLGALASSLKLGCTPAHRALEDARACLALFLRCVETGAPYTPTPPAPIPEVLPATFSLLDEALCTGQTVMIEYRDGRGRTSRREVRPIAIDEATVEAHCLLRNDTRHFYISRIRRVWKPGE